MTDTSRSTVAVVQTAPVIGDTAATVRKAEQLIREAVANGAEVAVFPEAFIGGYPKGRSFDTVVGTRTPLGREQYREYFDAAVSLPGPEIEALAAAAAEAGVFVVIGVIERDGGTLYCTAVLIDPAAAPTTPMHARRRVPKPSDELRHPPSRFYPCSNEAPEDCQLEARGIVIPQFLK